MFESLDHYRKLILALDGKPKADKNRQLRELCRTDLFFLLYYGLWRLDMWHPWVLARCKEVQKEPNSMLDLWSRGHFKTSIITTGLTIQDILSSHGDDPDPKWNGEQVTIGIFSWKRAIAQSFLSQIKRELESNTKLKELFPDILYENPDKDSPKWSSDGLIVKRSGNPKECSVEACGVVEGQPTGMHYSIRVYDDMVTIESVSTPDMQQKVVERWEMSLNLGNKTNIERYVGTRYHFADTYKTIMDRGVAKARIHPATIDGTVDGQPVLMTRPELDKKRKDMGIWTFYTQMLLSPQSDTLMGFKPEWIRYYDGSDGQGMNKYIICDPANAKKKSSDYTYFEVIGLGSDNNYYTLDMVRDRLNLIERTQKLFDLHRKWRPKGVGYEQYGMQADIQHIKDKQQRENYRFEIIELGGTMPKTDRIRKLVPVFEQKRWYMPRTCFKTDYEGKLRDLVDVFINEEYLPFPVAAHDDMCFVAGTKIATKRGAVNIEEVVIGDKVLTPYGWDEVIKAGFTGIRPVIKEIDLEGTGNHPIFTLDKGFIPLDSMTRNPLIIRTRLCDWIKITLLSLLSSTDENTLEWVAADTICQPVRLVREGKILRAYTSLFGSLIQARQFRKVMKLITKTAIRLTMNMTIWSVYQKTCIAASLKQWIWKKLEPTLRSSGILHQLGIDHLRVWLGIKNMQNALSAQDMKGIASSAALTSWLSYQMPVIAPIDADGNTAIGYKRVFNLAVRKSKCYYANNILVHNCDGKARILDESLGALFPKLEVKEDPYEGSSYRGSAWAS